MAAASRTGSGNSVFYEGQGSRATRRVVVTVTHRLNAFGFLYLAEMAASSSASPSNVGMQDIVLALEWVRDNIDPFGGDPGSVTIFGQSGGGGKTAILNGMPAAKGLFHRAIIQSTLWDTAIKRSNHTRRPPRPSSCSRAWDWTRQLDELQTDADRAPDEALTGGVA